jgi:predicted metal-dependent peptidase
MDTQPAIKRLKKRISRAKFILLGQKSTTFFSALLATQKLEITRKTATASTNGISIRFNPDFIDLQTDPKLLGLMMHELGHIIFQHIGMHIKYNLNQKLLNMAGDHHINLWLLRLGYELPDGALADRKYIGWSTMKIYRDLETQGTDTSSFEVDIYEPPKDMAPEEHTERITNNILKAVTQARINNDHGSIPGELLDFIEEAENPQLPWQVVLAPYMADFAKEDFSYARPNRRYLPDWYLPTLRGEGIKQITLGCDVSGSMNMEDINEIFSEAVYIWDILKPDKMRVMTFDTAVHMNEVFTEGDSLKEIELKHGGGTNVQPLLDTIREENPVFALIFTDGYFSTPDMSNITSKIFWIIKDNKGFKNPRGTIIHF